MKQETKWKKGDKWAEIVRYYDYADFEMFWFYKDGKKYSFVVFHNRFEPILILKAWDLTVVAVVSRTMKQMRRVYSEANATMKNNTNERTLLSMGVRDE